MNLDSSTEGQRKLITVDMQKVLLLRKLATKDSFFSRKLAVFNETFCDVRKNMQGVCVFFGTRALEEEKQATSQRLISTIS